MSGGGRTMLAAYCSGYNKDDCQLNGSTSPSNVINGCQSPRSSESLVANYEVLTCPRPSLQRTDSSSSEYAFPPGTLLVKTIAASICGSDLFGVGGCASTPNWRRPTDLLKAMQGRCGGSGHEAIGRIVDIVPSSSSSTAAKAKDSKEENRLQFSIGQKVLAMPLTYLYKVDSMRSAFENATGTKLEDVFPEETGAFCEYFISYSCVCLPLPENVPRVDFDHRWYVMAQPLGTVLHACQKLGSVIGSNIAIVGQGQNGLIMSQMLSNMGARRIIALDLLEERLVYSKRNNATHTVHVKDPMDMDAIRGQVEQITEGQMCDIAVDMVGHQSKTLTLCSKLTKNGGKVLIFGLPPARDEEQMSIRYVDLAHNLTYVCSHSPEFESFRLALELIEQGRFDPSTIFTHEIPFRDFVDAYDKACNYRDGVVKCLLTFQE